MGEQQLVLTPAERQWLAYSLPADLVWPPSDDTRALLGQLPGLDHVRAGGPRLRVVILALEAWAGDAPSDLECTLSELWLLDSLLTRSDLRTAKLPDGTLLLTLARKVWTLLLECHEEQLPRTIREEHEHARSGDDPHASADAVASAEAILRSRNGEGASEDLPPAAP